MLPPLDRHKRPSLTSVRSPPGRVSSAMLNAMDEIASSDEFFRTLRLLIDAWCDRRCLRALSYILPAYLAFDGLTNGWADLYVALGNVRLFASEEITEAELDVVVALISGAAKALYRIPPSQQ